MNCIKTVDVSQFLLSQLTLMDTRKKIKFDVLSSEINDMQPVWKSTHVLEEHVASVFNVKEKSKKENNESMQ
jgi:hypothetical protein